MATKKYKFNPESLIYEEVSYSFSTRVLRIFPFFLTTFIFVLGFYFLLDRMIESPKMKNLLAEESILRYKIKALESNIEYSGKVLEDLERNDDQIFRTYFEVNPLLPSIRDAGFGGNDKYELYKNSKYAHNLAEIDRDIERLTKKMVVQSISYDEVLEMARTKEKRLAARPAIQPVSIAELTRFGSAFGMRIHPILKVLKMHEGIDLTAPRGTEIFATADGVVLQAGPTNGGYGNKILIDHGFGYRTLYGHCYKIIVKPGQKVKRGDVIGTVGSTGLSTCPHLHYEVHVNGRKVNPLNYYANDLSADEYDKMIELLSDADPNFDIN